MNSKKERERIIKSSQKALQELDKLINQTIDVDKLDPEKARAAAVGKIEAIEGSLKILKVIEEIKELDDDEISGKGKRQDRGFNPIEDRV